MRTLPHDSIPGRRPGLTGAAPGVMVMAVLLVALWITTHPYYGVIHDSRIYLVQALGSLYPGRFSQDLFLKYGSQDGFSVFTPLYSQAVRALGPARAAFATTMAGEALWLSALVFLTRSLFAKTPEFLFATVGAIAFDTEYVGRILTYAEPFVQKEVGLVDDVTTVPVKSI